jgi:hypothetical protein
MEIYSPKRLEIDYAQQSIETELLRLRDRVRMSKERDRWDSEILYMPDKSWVTYIQPARLPDGPIENAIYFIDVGNISPAYSVVWEESAEASAQVYSAGQYEHIYSSTKHRYFGFKLHKDSEWLPLDRPSDKLTAAELLEALPETKAF